MSGQPTCAHGRDAVVDGCDACGILSLERQQEAEAIAAEVLAGKTRSYVAAAEILARYVLGKPPK